MEEAEKIHAGMISQGYSLECHKCLFLCRFFSPTWLSPPLEIHKVMMLYEIIKPL